MKQKKKGKCRIFNKKFMAVKSAVMLVKHMKPMLTFTVELKMVYPL